MNKVYGVLFFYLAFLQTISIAHAQKRSSVAVQTVFAEGNIKDSLIAEIPTIISYDADPQLTGNGLSVLTRAYQTGSVWGLAYDGIRRRIFASALAKRHAAFGPLGSGGIYSFDLETQEVGKFVSLDAVGFPTGPVEVERDLGALNVPAHDSLMFGLVGKIGLGGIDISEDGRHLWVVNLYDRKVYRIQIPLDGGEPTRSEINSYSLPSRTYSGGEVRPFAVKRHKDVTYVGAIIDAQESQNPYALRATVFALADSALLKDNTEFNEVISFSLDYPRGAIDYGVSGWFPWIDNYQKAIVTGQTGWMIYPQPILADIEFDHNEDMVVSLMDRLGHQTGEGQLYRSMETGSLLQCRGISGGDILRLTHRSGKYYLEHNGNAGESRSAGTGNNEGPGGGEFYFDDGFVVGETSWHRETVSGGIAILPEGKDVLVAVREPEMYATGGVKWMSNENGAVVKRMTLTPPGGHPGYFNKQNTVGDILILPEASHSSDTGQKIYEKKNETNVCLDAHPNPTEQKVFIQYRGAQSFTMIWVELRDATGKLIWRKKQKMEDSRFGEYIDLSALASGIYYITITEQLIRTSKALVKL